MLCIGFFVLLIAVNGDISKDEQIRLIRATLQKTFADYQQYCLSYGNKAENVALFNFPEGEEEIKHRLNKHYVCYEK